jgi:hypothetical protein
MIVKRVGALSVGKIWGAIYGLFGLVLGVCISLYWLLQGLRDGTIRDAFNDFSLWSVYGIGAVVLLPLLYALIGMIAGLIVAVLYNWSAKIIGGIEIELK